jgi:hypothetical protein
VLLLAKGNRPSADDMEKLVLASAQDAASRMATVQIAHRQRADDGRLELLSCGLSFELEGLHPADSRPVPYASYFYGLPGDAAKRALEAIALYPGPHITSGATMLPVVRAMAAVAGEVARHLDVQAICWRPSGCWMDASYFRRVISIWQAGGAFPALGLTAVECLEDGTVLSDGVSYFTGQDLLVKPRKGEAVASTVKLAVRMIDYLVRNGAVEGRTQIPGPDGEMLLAEATSNGRRVVITRQA